VNSSLTLRPSARDGDKLGHGSSRVWSAELRYDVGSPLEAINSGGDCKAFSIAKYFALLEAGIAADHLRLVIVHARSGNHMVVAALWQDRWFILDNLTLVLVPDALSDYVPLLVLDDKGVRSYVVAPANY
jgi:predicted transglutaminase-like cysteine proteinase